MSDKAVLRRYDLVEFRSCGEVDHEMRRTDDGDYVRFEDHEASQEELRALLHMVLPWVGGVPFNPDNLRSITEAKRRIYEIIDGPQEG